MLNNAIVVISGPKNSGKSILTYNFARPSQTPRVFAHDSERSSNAIREQYEESGYSLGYYGNLAERFPSMDGDDILDRISAGKFPWKGDRERSVMEKYFLQAVEDIDKNLTKGQFDIYIHDAIDKLEAGVQAYVERVSGIPIRSRGGEFWLEGYYPVYEAFFEAIFKRGVKTIILTTHSKNSSVMRGNKSIPVPNKVEPSGKPILYKISSLMLFLIQDARNVDGAPAGIVLKERLPKMSVVNDRWVVTRMLPKRIPHCVWYGEGERSSIEWYLQHGANLENPAEGESLSPFEQELFSEFLSDIQMRLMVADAERELKEMGLEDVKGSSDSAGIDPTLLANQSRLRKVMEEQNVEVDEAVEIVLNGMPPVLREKARADLETAAEGV